MIDQRPQSERGWRPPARPNLLIYKSGEGKQGGTGPFRARRFVKYHLSHGFRRPDLADDAAVIVSELVTNALSESWRCWLYLHRDQSGIVVAVWDPLPDPPRESLQYVPDDPTSHEQIAGMSTSGRGLTVVRFLSAGWGWFPATPRGKVVWALLRPQNQDNSTNP